MAVYSTMDAVAQCPERSALRFVAVSFVSSLLLLLGGCASAWKATFFKEDGSSGKTGEVVEVAAVGPKADDSSSGRLPLDGEAAKLVDEQCGPIVDKQRSVTGAVTVLLPILAKYGFDAALQALDRNVDELRKRASPEAYGGRIFLAPGDQVSCIVVVRKAKQDVKNSDEGRQSEPRGPLTLVLKLRERGKAWIVEPIYAGANTAIAITKPGKGGDPAKIKLAGVVAARGIDAGKHEVELGSFSVSNLTLDGNNACPGQCKKTDLILRPSSSHWASLTITVAELGDVGIPIDAALAELKAFREAMGPALRDVLKEELK